MERRTAASSAAAAPETPAAPAPSEGPAAARPRRKKPTGKRPAGSRWLNRLLALGCCASMLPLGFEWYWSRHPHHLEKPRKDDPWVRVIDAAPPEEALSSSVKKRWKHHPRHEKRHANVGADGLAIDLDEDEDGVASNASARAASPLSAAGSASDELPALKSKGSERAADASAGSREGPGGGTQPGVGATAVAPNGTDAGVGTTSRLKRTDGGAVGGDDDDDDIRSYLRQVDRSTVSNRSASGGSRGFGSSMGGRGGGSGVHRMWRVVPGGVHDIVEGSGENQTVFTTEGFRPPETRNGSYVIDHAAVSHPPCAARMGAPGSTGADSHAPLPSGPCHARLALPVFISMVPWTPPPPATPSHPPRCSSLRRVRSGAR